jgi:hypothetical protein
VLRIVEAQQKSVAVWMFLHQFGVYLQLDTVVFFNFLSEILGCPFFWNAIHYTFVPIICLKNGVIRPDVLNPLLSGICDFLFGDKKFDMSRSSYSTEFDCTFTVNLINFGT